jgi:hypothetical protein
MQKQAAIQCKTEKKKLDQVETVFDNSTAPPKDTLSSAKEIKKPASQPISTDKVQKKKEIPVKREISAKLLPTNAQSRKNEFGGAFQAKKPLKANSSANQLDVYFLIKIFDYQVEERFDYKSNEWSLFTYAKEHFQTPPYKAEGLSKITGKGGVITIEELIVYSNVT